MIVKLKGFIEFCGEDYIDLDVNGIVFRVFVSNKSIKKNLHFRFSSKYICI